MVLACISHHRDDSIKKNEPDEVDKHGHGHWTAFWAAEKRDFC